MVGMDGDDDDDDGAPNANAEAPSAEEEDEAPTFIEEDAKDNDDDAKDADADAPPLNVLLLLNGSDANATDRSESNAASELTNPRKCRYSWTRASHALSASMMAKNATLLGMDG